MSNRSISRGFFGIVAYMKTEGINVIETKEKEPKKILYRYENASFAHEGNITDTSHPELVGQWFTDNLQSLKDYIHMRQPGGEIIVVEVPKNRLDEFHVSKHPIASTMDTEPENWIIPEEILKNAKRIKLSIPSANSKKFIFKEWSEIDNFVDSNLKDF